MKRDDALGLLRTHRGELAHYGVRSLAVFGSVARDEARPDSDVDVLVDFEGGATFDRYFGLLEYLEALLGCQVDLVTRPSVRPELRERTETEALRVA
jgi:predicted nucleotidyltransferase